MQQMTDAGDCRPHECADRCRDFSWGPGAASRSAPCLLERGCCIQVVCQRDNQYSSVRGSVADLQKRHAGCLVVQPSVCAQAEVTLVGKLGLLYSLSSILCSFLSKVGAYSALPLRMSMKASTFAPLRCSKPSEVEKPTCAQGFGQPDCEDGSCTCTGY